MNTGIGIFFLVCAVLAAFFIVVAIKWDKNKKRRQAMIILFGVLAFLELACGFLLLTNVVA